jgi:parallel beta-helix repeat protein
MSQVRRSARVVLALALWLGGARAAEGATLQVENTGSDGPACGVTTPCRSITRAVTNAVAGDTILVGPGMYGPDLDADGVTEPGDEPPGFLVVGKRVAIFSRFGASSTLVRSGFQIQSSGVVLGRRNRGFTIAPGGNPLLVGGGPLLEDFSVSSNVLVIPGDVSSAAVIAVNTRGRFEGNRVVSHFTCSAGFFMSSSADLLTGNTVLGCTTGFYFQSANGARLVSNAAIGNVRPSVISDGVGFRLDGTIAEFSRNLAVANHHGVDAGTTVPIPIFRNNSFAANTSNCGVRNFAGTLDASRNYWGAPTGPGADPADAACDLGGATTLTTPFLTRDPARPQSALR